MPHLRVIVPALALCLSLLAACGDDAVNSGAGSIHLIVSPGTSTFDTDGWDVRLDEGGARDVPDQGDLVFEGLTSGEHTLQLTDVELPCEVSGQNPRTVIVNSGDVTTVTFNVVCVHTGFIAVTTVTTGEDLDPDGYALSVDEANAPLIGSNDTATLAVDAGPHAVTLSGIADNCAVQDGEPTRSVTVTADETTDLTFEIVCSAVP